MGRPDKLSRYKGFIFLFLLIVATVSLVVIGLQVRRQNSRIETIALDTHSAFCSFKHDLRQRVDGTDRFLDEHPAGIPGVPNSVLRQSLKNQKLTLLSMSSLDCST